MSNVSAVEFATSSRIHFGLAVRDLESSVRFYRTLFGVAPTKTRPGYARFEVAEPPLNLALNEVGGATGPNNAVAHFGIQVKSVEAVQSVARRLTEAGLAVRPEEHVTCCYAVQSKVWAVDPDGNKWEVYVVLNDDGAQHHSSASDCCDRGGNESSSGACCPELPAILEAVQRGDLAAAAAAYQQADRRSACGCLTQAKL